MPEPDVSQSDFELTGGAICLDFANTVDNRPTTATERLGSYADLVTWAEQTGLIAATEGTRFRREAADRPRAAEAALAGARAIREALYLLFSGVAAGSAPPAESLAMLNAALPPSMGRRRLAVVDGRPMWTWDFSDGALDGLLAPVVESAAALLTGPDRERVRECQADNCGWLFIDRSRNRSRRWCDMSVCGNRAKVRRHYARRRATDQP